MQFDKEHWIGDKHLLYYDNQLISITTSKENHMTDKHPL